MLSSPSWDSLGSNRIVHPDSLELDRNADPGRADAAGRPPASVETGTWEPAICLNRPVNGPHPADAETRPTRVHTSSASTSHAAEA